MDTQILIAGVLSLLGVLLGSWLENRRNREAREWLLNDQLRNLRMQRFHEKSVEIRQWVDQVLRVLERLAHVLKIQAKPTVSILNKLNEAVDDLWYKEPTVFPKVASLGDKDLIQRADLFRQAVNQFKENARSKKMDEANKALIKVRVHAAEIYVLLDKLENAAFTGTPSSEKEVE